MLTAEHDLRCADGLDADDAYFTARYRTVEEGGVDAVRVCALARVAASDDIEEIASATPKQLVAIAEDIVSQTLTGDDSDAEPAVAVDAAAFRPVDGLRPLTPVTCVDEESTLVLWVPDAAPSEARQSLLCARARS